MLLHYVHEKVRWGTEVATFRTKSLSFFRIIHLYWLDTNIVLLNAKVLKWLCCHYFYHWRQFNLPPPLATPVLGVDVVRQTQSAWFIQMIDRVTTAKVHDLWKMLVRMSKTSTISFTLFKRLRTDSILLWIGYQRPVESAPIFKISLSLEWHKHEYRLVHFKPLLITVQAHY